jgi:hypothetical protein
MLLLQCLSDHLERLVPGCSDGDPEDDPQNQTAPEIMLKKMEEIHCPHPQTYGAILQAYLPSP